MIDKVVNLYSGDKKINLSKEVISSSDLLEYLDTVDFLIKILKKVEGNIQNIDSNTLYEIYYHHYKLSEMLEDSSVDTLVRKSALNLYEQLDKIISLLSEEQVKEIYDYRRDNIKVEKHDKIKYGHNERYDGLASKEIITTTGDFWMLVKRLFAKKLEPLIVLIVLYMLATALPSIVQNTAELSSVKTNVSGENLDISSEKKGSISDRLVNFVGQVVTGKEVDMSELGGITSTIDSVCRVVEILIIAVLVVKIWLGIFRIVCSLLYIHFRLTFPNWEEAEKSFPLLQFLLSGFNAMTSKETKEDCLMYIQRVRVRRRIKVDDRIDRNLLLLDELKNYYQNNNMDEHVISQIEEAIESGTYKSKYEHLASIECIYESIGKERVAA